VWRLLKPITAHSRVYIVEMGDFLTLGRFKSWFCFVIFGFQLAEKEALPNGSSRARGAEEAIVTLALFDEKSKRSLTRSDG